MKQAAYNLEERINLFMARKRATKALKFISTTKATLAMEYELEGEV